MKKAERIFGIVATTLLIIGVIFKRAHLPGANGSMTVALLLFDFGFLPLQLILGWRKTETKLQRFYCAFRFVAFFIILSGFVFKLMHWSGANTLYDLATFLLPGYIVFYFVLRILNQGSLPFMFNDLLITIIGYGIYLFLTSTLVSPQVAMGYLNLENKYIRMNSGLETSNRMIYNSLDSVTRKKDENLLYSIKELQKLGAQFYQIADSLKKGFYKELDGSLYSEAKYGHHISVDLAVNPDPGNYYFITAGNGILLKNQLDQYRTGVARIANRYHLQSGLIGMGLGTRDFTNRWGDVIPWEVQMFGRAPASLVLVNLSWIKQMVLLTEANLLNGLISQIDLSSEVRLLQELASQESERAMMLKENEIVRIRQQQELQTIQLEQSQDEVKQGRMMVLLAFLGIAFVLILFIISTRAYMLKQRDNKILAKQKEEITHINDELNQQNEEIAAQRDEIEAQRNLLVNQKDQIEKTHNEIAASIDYASRLQASILSDPGLIKETFSDHFILYKPRDKVSGDFYWWSQVGEQIVIAVADCTGHGVPGAFMSMLGISLLSEIVSKEFITAPDVILDKLRNEVIRSLNQTGEKREQKDGLDMALLCIHTETWNCQYAGANRPLYLIRDHELQEFKPDMMPISIYYRMDKFTSHEIKLAKNDQLYLFSDGYSDQYGGKERKKFKYGAFKQLLLDHTNDPMDQQKKVLTETIMNWKGTNEQIDDMVIVGLKV